MTNANSEQFDPYVFIDELVVEMGMQDEDETKLEGLKNAMFEALSRQLLQAAKENMEPEVVDAVMEDMQDEEDPGYIIYQILQMSPGAQLAMLEALDEFKTNTLEAFNQLKN